MTIVDVAALLLLGLLGLGGYRQGFLRGVARLLALVIGGVTGLALVLNLPVVDSAAGAGARAALIALGSLGVASAVIWLGMRSVPPSIHRNRANHILGIVPALLAGLVLLTLALGLADRVALYQTTQATLRHGLITGPLVALVDVLEQTLAGVR